MSDSHALGNGAIFRVRRDGAISVLASRGALRRPQGIAITPDGQLYVADYDASGGQGAILGIDLTTGAQTVVVHQGAFADPVSIAVAADGALWVADFDGMRGSGRLVRVDPRSGAQTWVCEAGALVCPMGIAVFPGMLPPPLHRVIQGTVRQVDNAVFESLEIAPLAALTVDGRIEIREQLTVGGTLVGGNIQVDGRMVVRSGGTVTHVPRSLDGIVISVRDTLVLERDAHFDLDGRGLVGGYTEATQSSGETFDATGRIVAGSLGIGLGGAGGSHGGSGGDGNAGGRAGATYGEPDDPRWLGAGGGSGAAGGGNGGGRATIRAGTCIIDGLLSANGTAGSRTVRGGVGGGGAGGSVRLDVRHVLAGTGSIRADGGPGACGGACSGASGGGRIAITCATNRFPRGNITAAGGLGGIAGSDGTVRLLVGPTARLARPRRDSAAPEGLGGHP